MIGQDAQNSAPILVDFLFGHGLFSQVTYAQLSANCGNYTQPLSAKCTASIMQAQTEVNAVNIYDIYRTCAARCSSDCTQRISPL